MLLIVQFALQQNWPLKKIKTQGCGKKNSLLGKLLKLQSKERKCHFLEVISIIVLSTFYSVKKYLIILISFIRKKDENGKNSNIQMMKSTFNRMLYN